MWNQEKEDRFRYMRDEQGHLHSTDEYHDLQDERDEFVQTQLTQIKNAAKKVKS